MRRRRWTLAVVGAALVSTVPLGAGWAADASDQLPTDVADIHHTLRSVDHVIVYSDAPSPVIEQVLIHGRRESAAAGADAPAGAADPVGSPATRTDDPANLGVPTGWAPLPPGPAGRPPVEAAVPPAPGAAEPSPGTAVAPALGATDRPRAPGPVSTGGGAVASGGVIPDPVVRQILDRVDELVDATREATLGARRAPAR